MKKKEQLNYHEGLSYNQVKIILKAFNLDSKEFDKWMVGQTCPVIPRNSQLDGTIHSFGGVYEYDLFRYIAHKKEGVYMVWD